MSRKAMLKLAFRLLRYGVKTKNVLLQNYAIAELRKWSVAISSGSR